MAASDQNLTVVSHAAQRFMTRCTDVPAGPSTPRIVALLTLPGPAWQLLKNPQSMFQYFVPGGPFETCLCLSDIDREFLSFSDT